MTTWRHHYDLLIQAPQVRDLLDVTSVEAFAQEYGIRSLPLVTRSPDVPTYLSQMGIGQVQDLDKELGRRFSEDGGLGMGWQYKEEAAQIRQWMKERQELEGWNSLQVPSLKADGTERKKVVDAALELARTAREATIVELLSGMASGVDAQKWMQYAAERVIPHDRMLIALRSLSSALDGVGEPDQSVREDALSSIKMARERLRVLDEQIDRFWQGKFLVFENTLREKWGLTLVKKNANKKKSDKQEVTA